MNWDESKYFKPEEFVCPCGCKSGFVEESLIKMLNQARSLYGHPIKINSGYRCEKHNKEVGGKPDSAHLHGQAADLDITDSESRYALLKVLYRCGFERIGVGSNLIHVDVSITLPRPRLWTY